MTQISREELYDTIADNLRPVERNIGKAIYDFEARMAALEVRLSRDTSRSQQVSTKEFNQLMDDVEELADMVKDQGAIIKRMWAAIEELSLGSDS